MFLTENISAIIFDMDGTLVDNIPYHKEAWIKFLKKHKINLDPDQFEAQNHGTIDQMIKRFFGSNTALKEVKKLGQEKESLYRTIYKDNIKEVEGLTAFLKELKSKNIKIALATNCDSPNIDFVLDRLHIRKYFDIIIGGHQVANGKPHPEIYNSVLKKLAIKNNQVIAFEDSKGGIESALKAGIEVAGITTSYKSDKLLEYGCFQVIHDFTQIQIS